MRRYLIFFLFLFGSLTIHVFGGYTWVNPIRLTWNTSTSSFPVVAVDALNRVHVVWTDKSGLKELYYKRSTDGGVNWGPLQRLTWSDLSDTLNPSLTIDSNKVLHLVYEEYTMVNSEIIYKQSTDGGLSWRSPQRLTWNPGLSMEPQICVDSNDVLYTVWSDQTPGDSEIFLKRSTDGGNTWSPVQRLTWNSRNSSFPVITTVSGTTVHIIWSERLDIYNRDIFYKRSLNSGVSWSALRRLTWTTKEATHPDIAVDSGGIIHAVWEYGSLNNKELYYKRSTDNGNSWTAVKRLIWLAGNSAYPSIAVDINDTIGVVWDDNISGQNEIHYKESTNGGVSWTPANRITWVSGQTWRPFMASGQSGAFHLVYADNSAGNYEICYKKRLVSISLVTLINPSFKKN